MDDSNEPEERSKPFWDKYPDIPPEMLSLIFDAFATLLEDPDATDILEVDMSVPSDQPEFEGWLAQNRDMVDKFLASGIGKLDTVMLISDIKSRPNGIPKIELEANETPGVKK